MAKVMYLNYSSSLEKITELNSSFDTGVLRIAYHGLNRNNSFISKDNFEKAIPSMFNCPVVTNYDRNAIDENGEKGDFGSHDAHLEIEKDANGNIESIEVVNDTYPIGVVYESADNWWEEIEDDSGIHEYLCTNVILWKRQDAYNKLSEGKTFNHSMEIDVLDGSFVDQGWYEIRDFQFTAFCILSNSVEPCFESSNIQLFSKDTFKTEFTAMIKELKETTQFSLNQSSTPDVDDINNSAKEGGMGIVNEKLELLNQYNLTPEQLNFSIEDLSIKELDAKVKEYFSLTAQQFKEELVNELTVEKIKDTWGWEYSKYSYVDHKDNIVFAYDRSDNWKLYGFEFTNNGDKIEINFDSKKRKKFEIVDFEEGVSTEFNLFPQDAIDYAVKVNEKESESKFSEQINDLNGKVNEFTKENSELKEFKAKVEKDQQEAFEAQQKQLKDELVENYSKVLSNDEIKTVLEKDLSVDEIEKEFKLIFADKELTTKFSKKTKKSENEIPITFNKKTNDNWTSCIKK